MPPPLPALAESIDYGLDANQEDEGEDVAELEVGAPRSTFFDVNSTVLHSCLCWAGWRCEEHAQPRHPSLQEGRVLLADIALPGSAHLNRKQSPAAFALEHSPLNVSCHTFPLLQAAAKPLRHGYDHVLAEKVHGGKGGIC